MIDLISNPINDVTLVQTLDVYITPEIIRRKELGLVDENFRLYSFQILFHLMKELPEIRFNEECRIVVEVKSDDKIKKIRLDELEDGNCGHLCYFVIGKEVVGSFDFRYNKKLAQEHLMRSKEFIKTAEYALLQKYTGAFIDNLYSAIELISKARLLLYPDKETINTRSHKAITTKINNERKLGNIDTQYVDLVNTLQNLRASGRYLNGVDSKPIETYQQFLNIAKNYAECIALKIK